MCPIPSTLADVSESKRIADASFMNVFRAAVALRHEPDPVSAAMDKALEELRRLCVQVGGRNKLGKLYLGRGRCAGL